MTVSKLSASTTGAATTSGAQTAAQASSSASPLAAAVTKADARIQAQMGTASTQISSLGKLKSAVSDLQRSAGVLSGLAPSVTASDVKTGVSQFVSAFNASMAAAKATATSMSAGDASGAKLVSNELSRSATSNPTTLAAMKKLGFKPQADGTLKVDAAALDAALKADPVGVQSTLTKLGGAAGGVAAKELAAGGHVAGPLTALNQRANTLKNQHSAMQAMAQDLSASSSTSSTSYLSQVLAAYKSNS